MGKRYQWRGPVDLGGAAFRLRAARHRAGKWLEPRMYRAFGQPVDRVRWRLWAAGRLSDAWMSRRGAILALPEATRVWIAPARLDRIIALPRKRKDAPQPRKGAFFWAGPWDEYTRPLHEHPRVRMMDDVWAHRDDVTQSASWAHYVQRMEEGRAYARTPKGLALDTPENIRAFLEDSVALVTSMQQHGYRDDLTDEELHVAVDRDGGLIKVNVGRKRLAAARLAGVARIPVRIAHVHADWWAAARQARPDTPRDACLADALQHDVRLHAPTPEGVEH